MAKKLFVRGLSLDTMDDGLRQACEQYFANHNVPVDVTVVRKQAKSAQEIAQEKQEQELISATMPAPPGTAVYSGEAESSPTAQLFNIQTVQGLLNFFKALTDTSGNLSSVQKNSILLIDFTNQFREQQNIDHHQALLQACPTRLRPILMTATSTVGAAIPPALALGPGAETRIPMAITVIGGVIVSTLLTLFVVPCLYSLLTKIEGKRKKVVFSSDPSQ